MRVVTLSGLGSTEDFLNYKAGDGPLGSASNPMTFGQDEADAAIAAADARRRVIGDVTTMRGQPPAITEEGFNMNSSQLAGVRAGFWLSMVGMAVVVGITAQKAF